MRMVIRDQDCVWDYRMDRCERSWGQSEVICDLLLARGRGRDYLCASFLLDGGQMPFGQAGVIS